MFHPFSFGHYLFHPFLIFGKTIFILFLFLVNNNFHPFFFFGQGEGGKFLGTGLCPCESNSRPWHAPALRGESLPVELRPRVHPHYLFVFKPNRLQRLGLGPATVQIRLVQNSENFFRPSFFIVSPNPKPGS